MGGYRLWLPVSLSVFFLFALKSIIAQPGPSFKCMTNNATCEALVGYASLNTTTLTHIQSLFQVKDLSSILGINLLPSSTPENFTIYSNQTVKIPFPCRCIDGTGISDRVPIYTVIKGDYLYHIANEIFSGLVSKHEVLSGSVTYEQIANANKIRNVDLIYVGQKLWIPLPCSCDEVEGQKVVHYAHVMAPGSTLDQVATEFGTTTEILENVNGINASDGVKDYQVIDVPLKGQVLQNLASPSEADGAIMKKMNSSLISVSGWSGSDFCIWSGVVCNINGFVISISLPSHNISGTLPADLNSLSQLTTISLQNNHLSGPLPSFANLSSLNELHLDSNNFTSVPSGAFTGLSSLKILSLEDNPHLNPWNFPSELADSSTLVSFYAKNANLIGPIPDIFGSLSKMQNLRLSYNKLTGPVPGSLRETLMQNLWLENQHMGLSGPLDFLAGMSLLEQVWLQGNNFTGSIPNLSNSTSIFDLQLQNNQLSGIVPQSLLLLPGLLNISLQNNKFQGPFPVFPESVTVSLGTTTNLFCRDVPGDCDPQVTILLEVAGALSYPLKLAEAWQGNDACKKWPFITCDASRNIIKVNLSKQGFYGSISPALPNFTLLTELYLNDNNLTGTIPSSLTTLHQLKIINLSNNNLSGEVPSFRSSVTVLTAGNRNIGQNATFNPTATPIVSKKPSVKIVRILLSVLLPIVSVFALWILVYVYKKRRHHSEHEEETEKWGSFLQLTPNSPLSFSYKSLKTATNNFDEQKKLGKGGFGVVFEGKLNNGTKVAVKRLDHLGPGKKEFLAEVWTIGSIHHVNLVKLVGFCADKVHRLLVYEYMSNGSLDTWIFKTNSRDSLPWDTKRKIILQIAKGLAYLHEDCQKKIAHLDVKPQNVLLDDEFNAKISDFGLAKLIDRDQTYVMTQMRGTRGYLAPEWLGRKITERVDVYSFGVMVLEVIFERKNLDYLHPEESTLIMQVRKRADENQLLDLLETCNEDMQRSFEDVDKTIRLAVWCLHTEPATRPSMSMVVKVLEGTMSIEAISDCNLTSPETNAVPRLESITEISDTFLLSPR